MYMYLLIPTVQHSIVTPQQWQSFSAHNVAKAESEIQNSTRLREAMNQSILQSTSNLEALWIDTDYAFRKRVHEVEQAKHELEWQLKNVRAHCYYRHVRVYIHDIVVYSYVGIRP